MPEIVEYPAWHDRARAMYNAGGKTQNQIADFFGFPASRCSHILGKSWKLYLTLYRDRFGHRVEPGVINRRIEEGYYTFVPVPGPSPAEVEADKRAKKQQKIVKRFEDIDMPRLRTFPDTKEMIEGKVIKGHIIRCHKCGKTEKYQNFSGSVSTEHLPKEFARRGWFVGNNERTDTCPECQKARRETKTEAKKEEAMNIIAATPVEGTAFMKNPAPTIAALTETAKNGSPAISPAVSSVKIETDRAMDRTERRLIFARLNDIYIDETKGYSGDWTDAKVAEELGVSVAWVAEVRDADFGPEINANIVKERHSEILAIGEKIERHIVLVDKKLEQLQQLDDKVTAAMDTVEASIKRFDELRKSLETEDQRIEVILNDFKRDAEEFQKKFADFKASSLQS